MYSKLWAHAEHKTPRGRMHAEKHRTALPGHFRSIPGVIPGKALETAQRPADGARKLQIVALRVMRLLGLRQHERLALKTNQRDALSLVGAIVHLILGRVVQAADALVSLVTSFLTIGHCLRGFCES